MGTGTDLPPTQGHCEPGRRKVRATLQQLDRTFLVCDRAQDLNGTKTWCVLILLGLGREVLQQLVDCLFYLLFVLFRLV